MKTIGGDLDIIVGELLYFYSLLTVFAYHIHDVMVDDGGHKNNQIYHSLHTLWPYLRDGGLYYVEDVQVGRKEHYNNPKDNVPVFADMLKDWIDQLIMVPEDAKFTYPILPLVKAIYCQCEACVIIKCGINDKGRTCKR